MELGKPWAGKPPARFDEGSEAKAAAPPKCLPPQTLLAYSTRRLSTSPVKPPDKCHKCGATPPMFLWQPCACGHRFRTPKPHTIHTRARKIALWHFAITLVVLFLGAAATPASSLYSSRPVPINPTNGLMVFLAPVCNLLSWRSLHDLISRNYSPDGLLLAFVVCLVASSFFYGYVIAGIRAKVAS